MSLKLKMDHLKLNRLGTFVPLAIAILSILVVLTLIFSYPRHPFQFTKDEFIFSSQAYRLGLGQTPHVDFFSPLGIAIPFLGSVWLALGGAWTKAILIALCILNLYAIFTSLYLYKNLNVFLKTILFCLIFSILGSLLDISNFILFDQQYTFPTTQGYYRPLCMGLLLLTAPYFFLSTSHRNTHISASLLSLALIILLFTKATYFIPFLSLALISFVFIPSRRRLVITTGLISLIALTFMELALNRVVSNYVLDLLTASSINSNKDVVRSFIERTTLSDIIIAATALIVGAFGCLRVKTISSRMLLISLLTLGVVGSAFINTYDTGLFDSAYLVLIFLLISIYLSDLDISISSKEKLVFVILALPVMLLAGSRFLADLRADFNYLDQTKKIASLAQEKGQNKEDWLHNPYTTNFKPLRKGKLRHRDFGRDVKVDGRPETIEYTDYFISFGDILKELDIDKKAGVAFIDLSDPFLNVYKLGPAKFTPSWYHHQLYSPKCSPDPSVYFYDVQYVILPRYPIHLSGANQWSRGLLPIIEITKNEFELVYDELAWQVYKKPESFIVSSEKPMRYSCLP